jgi:hypothetical protein
MLCELDHNIPFLPCAFALCKKIYPTLKQFLPFANTLALTPFPLWIGATYGIGLFWCKEDQNSSDALLTAASCLDRGSGCGGPSNCVYIFNNRSIGCLFCLRASLRRDLREPRTFVDCSPTCSAETCSPCVHKYRVWSLAYAVALSCGSRRRRSRLDAYVIVDRCRTIGAWIPLVWAFIRTHYRCGV